MFSSWTAPDSAKEGQRQKDIQSKGVNAGALVPEETLDPLFLSVSCPIDTAKEGPRGRNSKLGRKHKIPCFLVYLVLQQQTLRKRANCEVE